MEKFQKQSLHLISSDSNVQFRVPEKKINEGEDVSIFLLSKAYADVMTFILQLNASVFPHKIKEVDSEKYTVAQYELGPRNAQFSPAVQKLRDLVAKLSAIVEEAPPDSGKHRFGNPSFRKWYDIVKSRMDALLNEHLPEGISRLGGSDGTDGATARTELEAYLLGSFGSAQRLDYGTGHELSFLAFLGGLWKLGAFEESIDGAEERSIVLGVFEPYLELVRRLILTYRLEPAGSHGVWGLDDHSFLPYIFGSAQLSPAIYTPADIVAEGSADGAPDPTDVARVTAVERERKRNMYFSAIGFIYDVKRGPFGEHSPILYDISGVKAGWAKINKGMIKMYNAEVLSKFPVVQHFPFGALFRWERDPSIPEPPTGTTVSAHIANQPQGRSPAPGAALAASSGLRDPMQETTRAPWASGGGNASARIPQGVPGRMPPVGTTTAPWTRPGQGNSPAGVSPRGGGMPPTAAPWARPAAPAAAAGGQVGAMPQTTAPWARPAPAAGSNESEPMAPTAAPWAKKPPAPEGGGT